MSEKFMIKEIREGLHIIKNYKNRWEEFVEVSNKIKSFEFHNIIFVARGSSDNAATWGKYYMESHLKIPVSLCAPSLFTIYKLPPNLKSSLVIAISQSGESDDICEVVRKANEQGALTIGITNNPQGKLAQIAQINIFLNSGVERSVAATKTYLSQLAAIYFLTNSIIGRNALEEFDKILNAMEDIQKREEEIKEKVKPYKYMEHCAILGRGFNLSTALETALKLKETSYIIAQAYSSADFMHGPLALASEGFPVFFFVPKGESMEHSLEVLGTLKEKRSDIFIFTNEAELIKEYEGIYIDCDVPEYVTPIPFIYPAQIFAYYLAEIKGRDPDNPRNIRKITITR
ncbi:MAG: SIS domain-containing protein [Dictyoglomus thermophilum]|uniref:SIS domain-containing protein n=1 Tax=Dictyoglomus thermophilum TaxID=14 RepID=A0A7C3PRH8_DICTH|nr:SIS domain-containing protein [Dictyoglomus thermophilum]MCX7720378.1 SIS domain-containing protein [Dictyoglomus thermophilum]TYT24480.1 SIS domain-containing protein [Dictyoglomus thermophilum]